MRRVITLLALLWAACVPAFAAQLAPFKASYSIRAGGLHAGSGELHLQQLADGRWSYGMRTRGWLVPDHRGLSVFRLVDGYIVPDSFNTDENDQAISFDWQSGRVTGSVGRKKFDLPTQPGLLDTLSMQVALMQELLTGRQPARFVIVDEDRIKEFLYAREGSESVKSIAGTHRTDIYSSRRPGSKKATYYWCAPDLGYLPLKVERRDGRDVEWTMTLTSLQR